MQNSTQTSESAQTTSTIAGKNLWDEILKAVFLTKPQQLFHLFKEVFHFAMQHCTSTEPATGEIVMRFPDSVVIYPEKNGSLSDTLRCRIIFSDESEHIYQIPTVKIQSYSLDEIHQKHLNFFLPYTLLRFRPLLKSRKQIDVKELTSFVEKIIVDLEEEVRNGILSQRESEDLVLLLTKASARIFAKHPHYHEEVFHLTEPLIKLPSQQIAELEKVLEQSKAEIEQKDNEINRLQKLLADNGILC